MLKKITVLTVSAVALFAMHTPVFAGKTNNGTKLNGRQLNGTKLNGTRLNGTRLNGLKLNGQAASGIVVDSDRSAQASVVHVELPNQTAQR